MGTFAALMLATPIFGFALTPPSVAAVPVTALPIAAQLETSADLEASGEGSSSEAAIESDSLPPEPVVDAGPGSPRYVQQLRKRARIAKIHRTMGIVTWASMGVAVIAGTIQYRNLYGVPFKNDNRDETPCVQGNAWPNQQQCSGTPWFHAITGYLTGGLYFTTLGLAMAMPDPDRASHGTSKYAKTVRTHKALRWVHLAGMVTQIALGIIIANPRLGLDRANDYGTLKALSGLHLASGYITLGALSWAGTIMLL